MSNDEATVTYIQSVQQMTEGHRWLQENVAADIVPRVAWQIDPFGLSNGMAYALLSHVNACILRCIALCAVVHMPVN